MHSIVPEIVLVHLTRHLWVKGGCVALLGIFDSQPHLGSGQLHASNHNLSWLQYKDHTELVCTFIHRKLHTCKYNIWLATTWAG